MLRRIVGSLCMVVLLSSCGRDDIELLSPEEYRAQLAAMVEKGQPEGANGSPLILEAGAKAREIVDDASHAWEAAGSDWDREPITSLDGLRFGALRGPRARVGMDLLAAIREAGVFEMVDEAGACPRFVEPIGKDPWSDDPDALREGMNVFQLGLRCVAAMRVAFEVDDMDGVVESFRRALIQARVCGWRLGSLDRIRAHGFATVALREVRQELMEGGYDAETCARLLGVMDEELPLAPVERCVRAIPVVFRWGAAADRARFRKEAGGSVGRALEQVDALCEAAIVELGQPLGARKRAGAGYWARVIAGTSGTEEEMEERMRTIPLADRVAGTLTTMLDNDAWLEAEIGATRIALSLELCWHEHGAYPASLDALVPEFLESMPLDPAHGGMFIYKLAEDDELGRAYLLYSTGPDGHDDGGVMAPMDVFALGFGNVPKGFDYDFMEPRRAGDGEQE